MSWNGNDKKDPWGRNDGPPDIDEAVKQFKKKINSIFGGGGPGGAFSKKRFLSFFGADLPRFLLPELRTKKDPGFLRGQFGGGRELRGFCFSFRIRDTGLWIGSIKIYP